MSTNAISHRAEIVVCDRIENEEVGKGEKNNPCAKKTECEDYKRFVIVIYDLNK